MGISDMIAGFINDMLDEDEGTTELQRQSLADRFNCVPSQINYVISTRFSPEHGYIVESRRGGGGYIRISRVRATPDILIMHMINSIGENIDEGSAKAFIQNAMDSSAIGYKEAKIMLAATSNGALKYVRPDERNYTRASILKLMLLNSL